MVWMGRKTPRLTTVLLTISTCTYYHIAEVVSEANNSFQKDQDYKLIQRLRKGEERQSYHLKEKERNDL